VMPISAVSCIVAWIVAWLSDGPLRGLRWAPIVGGAVWTIANTVSLAKLPIYKHLSAHWFLYCQFESSSAALNSQSWADTV